MSRASPAVCRCGSAAPLRSAHQTIITEGRAAIAQTSANSAGGSNDVLMDDVRRTHEQQGWFLAEHLVETPRVPACLACDAESWVWWARSANGATAMTSRATQAGAGTSATKAVAAADIAMWGLAMAGCMSRSA